MGKDEKKFAKFREMFNVKRLWERWRSIDWGNPMNKWKLLFFSIVAFIGIAGFSYGAVAGTSTTSFCAGCHEMSPEYVSHISTAHSEIKCTYCHIEPGFTNTIKGKVSAMTEVYHHVTRTQPDPIYATKPVKDIVCLQCHSENRVITASGDLIVEHSVHINREIACVTCHSGVAHGKMVERGINTSDTYDYWTEENADKLLARQYIKTNMGTCIDCHDQVNRGNEPWLDKYYTVPIPANAFEGTIPTSNEILDTIIRNEENDLELSMECQTCHMEITIPNNHKLVDWNENHKEDAFNELPQCINCHQEEKWVKRLQPQSIAKLLEADGSNLENYVPDMNVVESVARETQFCFTCHSEEIPGYE